MTDFTDFARWLKAARAMHAQRSLTGKFPQEDAAHLLGIRLMTFNQWERGKAVPDLRRNRPDLLAKLAAFMERPEVEVEGAIYRAIQKTSVRTRADMLKFFGQPPGGGRVKPAAATAASSRRRPPPGVPAGTGREKQATRGPKILQSPKRLRPALMRTA